ncbi:MAG TPA: 6-phosphofructokinase [Lachnospiraceae bacterium]|nr:6-phosphofructokinase [Lachnospiraceae bacterium]
MIRIGMLTSGGDCQALNAAMRGVAKGLFNAGKEVELFGFLDGYKGLIYGKYKMLSPSDFSGILTKGGTILGSSRMPFKNMRDPDENGLDKVEAMKHNYYKLSLDCLVILGGNGTHKTANLLREEGLNVVTLPKTIDNDLPVTDHCPGYGSAAKYIAASLKEVIRDNASFGAKKPTVCIVEIMGRNAGWLTAAAALAKGDDCEGCDAIYLPEKVFDIDKFVADVKELAAKKSSVVIAVSEGVKVADGRYVCEIGREVAVDAFGHKQMSGTAVMLADKIAAETGLKTRAIEFSTLQRAATHLASLTDINEAFQVGHDAVMAAEEGKTGMMITLDRNGDDPYQCGTSAYDIHAIANVERNVPDEWITAVGKGLTEGYEKYARPLIMGELQPLFVNGLPRHLVRK